MDKFIEIEERYSAHNFTPLPVVLVKGRGCWVFDDKGRKYLDLVNAASAVSHGHAHPKLLKVLVAQAKRLAVTSRVFYTDRLGSFLKELCRVSGMDRAMPLNTGAEAVETAIKAARKWGYQVKGVEKSKAEIIVAHRNFHGRTTTIISFSTKDLYKQGFGPYTPGFKVIPYGCVKSLEEAITPNTCAFLVEPIQGEAGVILPPAGWLKEVETICKRHNVLLILDEVQTGLGRTGKFFAYEHEKVCPDGLILGKALGGSLLPISAFLAKKEVMDVFTPGTHGSTFGGNPLAAAVGLEALKVAKTEKFAENSEKLGKYFLSELKKINSPHIADLRGKGLWIGMDINPRKITAHHITLRLMEEGILCKETHDITIRLAPPLIITKKEIDWALKRLTKVLKK
jgi:ornithine--oxo-acid transaminase